MKYCFLLILITLGLVSNGQIRKESGETNSKKNRFVVFPGCENSDDLYDCYSRSLQDFILKNINYNSETEVLFKSENDTLVFYANVHYDKLGYTEIKKTKLLSFNKSFDLFFKFLKNSLPKVKPKLDLNGQPSAHSVSLTLGFLLNRENKSLLPLYDYQPDLTSDQIYYLNNRSLPRKSNNNDAVEIIEQVPVYRGCEIFEGNRERKDCMSRQIINLITENFNTRVSRNIGLADGPVQILVNFKIDAKGNVVEINAKGPHAKLEQEAIRVINKIPRMKPGYQRGSPVIVPYTIPIRFIVKNKKRRKFRGQQEN